MLCEVKPTKPIAPYIGGKMRLASKIIERINQIPHLTYAEPFVGMGGVFLRRNKRPPCEIINDINGDVHNLFRIVREHPKAFNELIAGHVACRSEWDRFQRLDPTTLTDLQRAERFFYIQKIAFGGKVTGQAFAFSNGRGGRYDYKRIRPMVRAMHRRMADTVIECLDWQSFILKYDREGVLFYLDPPYFGNENDYGRGVFDSSHFIIMASILSNIKGRFILSINDRPQIREIFSSFKIESVDVSYALGAIEIGKRFGELIITN